MSDQPTVVYWPTCDYCDSTSVSVWGLGTPNCVTLCQQHIPSHNTRMLLNAWDELAAARAHDDAVQSA